MNFFHNEKMMKKCQQFVSYPLKIQEVKKHKRKQREREHKNKNNMICNKFYFHVIL